MCGTGVKIDEVKEVKMNHLEHSFGYFSHSCSTSVCPEALLTCGLFYCQVK